MLEVQGQSRAIALLQRAMRTERLAHTWVFAGPDGVGKFKLARELARAMMCDAPVTRPNGHDVPQLPPDFLLRVGCNACESCRAIENDTHPDLHVITKELNRLYDSAGKSKSTNIPVRVIRAEITGGVSESREYESKAFKSAIRGRGKFFIIQEAELMDPPAQNTLLKTLEEPPHDTYLIMITTNPQGLLPTIRSRSQLVLFNALPDEVVHERLLGAGMLEEDAQLMVRLARGSLGQALRWADDIRKIADKNAKTAERKAKRAEKTGETEDDEEPAFIPGGILAWTRLLAEALDALLAGRARASAVGSTIAQLAGQYAAVQLLRDPLTSKDTANRDGIALLMGIAAEWFGDRLRHGLGVCHALALPAASGALPPEQGRELIQTARTAEAEVDMNANVNLLLAATVTRWEAILRSPVAA